MAGKEKSLTEARPEKFVQVDKQTLIKFLYDFLCDVKNPEQIGLFVDFHFEQMRRSGILRLNLE